MNYVRLYSALLCVFFISVPQIVMTGFAAEIADMSEAELASKIGTMSEEDIAKLTEDDMGALAKKMADVSEGDETVFEDLLGKDSRLAKNPAFKDFQQIFKDQTAAIKDAAARESDISNMFTKSGGKTGISGAKGMTEDEGLDALRQTNQTRDMLSSVKKDFQKKCIDESKNVMRRFAKDLKMSDKDLAETYRIKLGEGKLGRFRRTIPQKEAGVLDDAITKALASGDRAALVKACANVARKESLSAVDDISSMIKNYEGGTYASIAGVGKSFLDESEKSLNQTWDAFTDEAAKGTNFDEVVEPGKTTPGEAGPKGIHGAGGETPGVTAMDKFLKDNFGSLEKNIGKDFDRNMSNLDATDARISKESGIELNSFKAKFRAKTFLRNPANAISESFSELGTSLRRTNLRDLADGAVDRLGSFIRSIKGKLAMMAETLFSAVLFMIPNIFQSAYLAQQEKASSLATWGKPIEYGGKVWQVPDWCINLETPASSIPLYVQIPVNSPGDSINATVAKMFASTINQGAPTSNNPVSNAIHNVSSDLWSFGSTTETKIQRYIFTDEFLKHTDIAVMYGSPSSMAPTGTVNIGGSEFTGQLISLKTGEVIDGSGESVDATGIPQVTGIPLIPGENIGNIWGTLVVGQTAPASQGLKPLAHTYATLVDKMESLGIKVTFTQYQNVGAGSSASNIGKSESDFFNTDCIDEKTGALKDADCQCLLVQGLTDLQNGLELNAQGKVAYTAYSSSMTSDQEAGDVTGGQSKSLAVEKDATDQIVNVTALAASSASKASSSSASSATTSTSSSSSATTSSTTSATATTGWQGLESVIPIYGWGDDKYATIIGTADSTGKIASGIFAGFDPSQVSFGGISKVTTNTNQTTSTTREYASADTVWAAQGCWIYLSSQTPFIQAFTESDSALTPSVFGPLTDYIVFMDEDLNIVPLMVPQTVTINYADGSDNHSYKKSEITLNPVIKYWTSLIFYNQSYFLYEGQPIMYDLKGNKYKSSELGTLPGAQKPSGIIPTFLNNTQGASISGNYPHVYDQLVMHKNALLYKLQELDMTIGGVLFKQSDYALSIGNQSLPTYTAKKNWSCFGTANIPDLLVALDGNSNPVGLPNANLVYMQSLITDITYELNTATNTWGVAASLPGSTSQQVATGYSLSPLKLGTSGNPIKKSDGSYEIKESGDSYLQNLGTWLGIQNPTLDGTLQQSQGAGILTINTTAKNDPTDASTIKANEKVITYVQKQRLKWLTALDDVVEIGKGANASLANLANTITKAYATSNKCYVYEMSPGLSLASSDYYVVVNTQSPTLTSLTQTVDLKKLAKGSKAIIVSLLTGTIYSLDGKQISNKDGFAKTVTIPANLYASGKSTTEIMYDAFTSKFKQLPTAFTQTYKSMVDSYVQAQMIPAGPYSFGKYKVSIRAVDKQAYNFVYFDAAQITKSKIVPTDMYIIVNEATLTPDSYNKSKKQLLISLITGIAVDQTGIITNKLLPANLNNIVSTIQSGWSPWIKENVIRLQNSYKARQSQMAEDQQNLENKLAAFAKDHDAATNKDQAAIVQIIKNLQPSGAGLAVPYAGLQYDKASGNYNYVHPSPLQQNELIYLFMGTGKIYASNGEYRSRYQEAHIQAVRDEYGVVVNVKTGKQKLGVPMMQPTLIMDPDDIAIKVGQSGKSLIASGSAEFPGEIVAMPKKGYGLYFSKIMDTYYVLNGNNDLWMSVDGGHVYQKNGQPLIENNPVALSKQDIPLLLYKNKDGFMQAYMTDGSDYSNISESNEAMTWLGLNEPFRQYAVTTDAKSAEAVPTKYTIEDSQKKSTTYTVTKNYSWQMLVLVPIDDQGRLLSNIPDSSYQYIQIVKHKNGKIVNVVYHGTAYEVAIAAGVQQGGANVYTCKPMQITETSEQSITLTDSLIDPDTTAPYVIVSAGAKKYKYAYVPKSYTQEEQETNRLEFIGGVTSSSPLPIAVGPMHEVSNEIGGVKSEKTIPDYVTHVLFEADLPVKGGKIQVTPVTVQSVYNAPTENPQYEEFAFKFMSDKEGFGGVYTTSETNPRFLYKIAGSVSKATPSTMTFNYIAKDSYVDLKTSAVYDAKTGEALGQCLNMNDFLKVLNACSVSVSDKTLEITNNRGKTTTVNPKGLNMLVYRDVAVAKTQEETIESRTALAANQ